MTIRRFEHYVCAECGGEEVSARVWVDLNSDVWVTDAEDPFCEGCAKHVDLVIPTKEEEAGRKQAVEGRDEAAQDGSDEVSREKERKRLTDYLEGKGFRCQETQYGVALLFPDSRDLPVLSLEEGEVAALREQGAVKACRLQGWQYPSCGGDPRWEWISDQIYFLDEDNREVAWMPNLLVGCLVFNSFRRLWGYHNFARTGDAVAWCEDLPESGPAHLFGGN